MTLILYLDFLPLITQLSMIYVVGFKALELGLKLKPLPE